MTLTEFEAVDFAKLWASLSPEVQASIGAMAIRHECAHQVAQDGGFDTDDDDRGEAAGIADEISNALPAVIWAAIPDVLPETPDDIYPCWQILDSRAGHHPDVEVYGRPGLWTISYQGSERWTLNGASSVEEIAGAQDLNYRVQDASRRWLFWTVADVKSERLRRHPEFNRITSEELSHARAA